MNAVFVTGGNGVLGSRLVGELLQETDIHVTCLIRAKNTDAGFERLKKNVAVYFPNLPLEQLAHRIRIVVGDLTEARFGLSLETYRDLCKTIDGVVHTAASVNLVGLYKSLAKINVQGTQRVVDFCLESGVPLFHTSSYSIIGLHIMKPDFKLKETDLNVGQAFKFFFYPKTKYEAEVLIHETPGLQWMIFRPGDIFGDSQTGAYPLASDTRKDVFYDIFNTQIETGLAIYSQSFFDVTPVDYVAKGMAFALQNPEYGRTLHLMNPTPMPFYRLVNEMVKFGYRFQVAELGDYIELFRKRAVTLDDATYQSYFTSIVSYFGPVFASNVTSHLDATATRQYLPPDLQCPLPTELLPIYLNYCVQQGSFLAPQDQKMATVDWGALRAE